MEKITGAFARRTEAADSTGCEEIKVSGMVHGIKDMGSFAFLTLRVCDGLLQCVMDDKNILPQNLKRESAVEITGKRVFEARAKQGFEIHIREIRLLSSPKEDMPVNISRRTPKVGAETDLAYRPATLRGEEKRNAFRLQAGLAAGFRDFLGEKGFTEIFSPKLVAQGAEGGANIFKLDYFGKKASLAQSPQFYKQTLVPVYGRVFEIGPVFRAEKHDTARHLNEYVSVDIEMGFIDSFYDVMEMETAMLRHAFAFLRARYSGTLEELGLELPAVSEIPAIRFSEAKQMAAERYGRKIKEPYDLEPEEERLIGELILETEHSDFVFITHYPSKKRPFYAMDDPADPKFTLSFDLLYKGMEITTGGQRIHDYDAQYGKMLAKGLDPSDFESYLMLHKYGCPPHGGLGLGLERFCMKLLDKANIRETSLFPRDTQRLTP